MEDILLKVLALFGALASAIFIIKHSAQFAKWIAALRARAKVGGLVGETETRIRELERIVKQHDSLLATVAAQPIAPSPPIISSQSAPAAATATP